MSEANVYILGRHLTKSSILPKNTNQASGQESFSLTSYSPSSPCSINTNSLYPNFTKINIPSDCVNYRKEDVDVLTSAMTSHVDQVSIGSDFIMILLSDGSLYSMGINRPCHHLGFTDSSLNTFETAKVLYLNSLKGTPVKLIASGAYYTILATRDDDLYGIGSNDYGQFHVNGSSSHKHNATPYFINYGKKQGDKITHIACCFSFSIIVTNGTELRLAGQDWVTDGGSHNSYLVHSRHVASNIFHTFKSPVQEVRAGAFHFVAVLKDGTVYGSGSNSREQLGQSFTRNGIQQIALNHPLMTSACCGSDCCLLISNNGEIQKLGESRYGFLEESLFKNLENYKDATNIQMCEQLLGMIGKRGIHLRGNNNTFWIGNVDEEFCQVDLPFEALFNTSVSHEYVGACARYYHIAFFLRYSKSVTKHFMFMKRRINNFGLSDITVITSSYGFY
ncbi:hypothetical protein C9374_005692 [Naegleria lovaniensis]|uniref:Uncharacterized protein n=1 Tax=Naegleria lovaniensis TaxID=51637 RepID=A0AA88GPW9_NAELO|nr:uncharacterized protein C9374_005692 [Naegleria lovaniensis]KAG2381900.1 hypothetical protein C9374_005692 [Naegleria lovaniensis]